MSYLITHVFHRHWRERCARGQGDFYVVAAKSRDDVRKAIEGTGACVSSLNPDESSTLRDGDYDYALPADADALRRALLEETNTEFVTRMLEQARSGPLMQAFIMQSIEQFARVVADTAEEELDTPMVSGAAWKACATELCAALDARSK